MSKYNNFSKEELIKIINFLESKIKKQSKYGLVWDAEKISENIITNFKNNIPLLSFQNDLSIKNGTLNNLLIEGDNVQVLFSLYMCGEEFIDIIYIDPPYNTGKKDFLYNDKFVDEDDSYKHSKWLNFMKKRLFLARKLLKPSGIIFISIDEHEYAQLKLLCDQIFGEKNYVENFIWIKNATKNLSKTTSTNHEYILAYAKNIEQLIKNNYFKVRKNGLNEVSNIVETCKKRGLSPKECENELDKFYKKNKNLGSLCLYKYVDDTYRIYTSDNPSAPLAKGVSKNNYDIIHPLTKKPCKKTNRGWAFSYDKYLELLEKNMIIFGKDEKTVPRLKRYLETVQYQIQNSIIMDCVDGKKQLADIFNSNNVFENPKPSTLIQTLIKSFPKDSIILDFFAGSGTTAQAILDLNKTDGGSRRFILCTNNENNICTNITYERIKTLITGIRKDGSEYSKGSNANLHYLKTHFLSNEANSDQALFNLMEKCDSLICIMENTFDIVEIKSEYRIYSNNNKTVFIYSDFYDDNKIKALSEKVNNLQSDKILYIYSFDTEIDIEISKMFKNTKIKTYPLKIYNLYKEILKEI